MTSLPLEVFIFHLFVVTFLGAVLGSFSSALLYRSRHHLSWIGTREGGAARSACPHCHHLLGIKDLIPLLSWLYQKGKCRYCRQPIARVYPLLETFAIIAALVIYMIWGATLTSLLLMPALPFFMAQIALFFTDKRLSFQFCGIILILGGLAACS